MRRGRKVRLLCRIMSLILRVILSILHINFILCGRLKLNKYLISRLNNRNKKLLTGLLMKKKLLLLLVALFSLTLVLAQEKSCEKQNYAISFGIKDNFTLKNFIMEIAVKKIINEKSQLRLFLSPEFKNENIDKSISDTSLTVDLNEKRIDLGIGLDYLWILAENNDIDFYGGSGLIVTYTERKDEYTSSYSFRKRESTIKNSNY